MNAFLAERPDGRLLRSDLPAASLESTGGVIGAAATFLTKGPEIRLPDHAFYTDKQGSKRRKARVRWWEAGTDLHSSLASMPSFENVPNGPVPDGVSEHLYPAGDKPVFFGHYQLTDPGIAANAICLDTPDRPIAWCWEDNETFGRIHDPHAERERRDLLEMS